MKEFGLYLPNVKDKNKRVLFRDEIRCIASLYARLLPKFITNKVKKILIDCVDTGEKIDVWDHYQLLSNREGIEILGNVEGVLVLRKIFDVHYYFSQKDVEKKKIILETLQEGIKEIAKHLKWDIKPFEMVYQKIIKENYINHWTWKKPKMNPSRTHYAEVYCEHEIDEFLIYILIKDKKNIIIKKSLIIKERPNEWAFAQYFGKLAWLNSKEVALYDKEGNNIKKISII